jgi:hypothetical protein
MMVQNALLGLIAFSFLLFIVGLSGKSRAVKRKSMAKSEVYQRVTMFSLILMLLSAIVYSLII